MDKIPPSCYFLTYFLLGILVYKITGFLIPAIAIFLISIILIPKNYYFLIPLFLIFVLLGYYFVKNSLPEFSFYKDFPILKGFVVNVEEREKSMEVIFKSYNFREKILLRVNKKIDINVGDIIILKNLHIYPLNKENLAYYWTDEIIYYGIFDGFYKVGKAKLGLWAKISLYIKEYIRSVFNMLSEEKKRFIYAVLLGETGGLSKEIKELFSNTGTSHILAISGLHIAILISFLSLFFRTKIMRLFLAILLFFYALLVGKPPVFRAWGMYMFFTIAEIILREQDSLNTLCWTALISLFLSPLNLFNISFQLSYMAILGLILFNNRLDVNLFKGYIKNIIQNSYVLFFFLLPINIYYFQKITISSMVANIFSIPLFQLILTLSFLMIGTSFFIPMKLVLSNLLAFFISMLFNGLQLIVINYKISIIVSVIILLIPILKRMRKNELLGV